MSLKYDNFRFYWAVVTEKKTLFYAKVFYLCAGILNDKSAISLAMDMFEM